MAVYKVEICGVNTSKLPLLTEEEKSQGKIYKGESETCFKYNPEVWCRRRKQ